MAQSHNAESHPYFPSGDWEGFYLYRSGPGAERHPMRCQLDFADGKVTGGGSDDVGAFRWQGVYSTVEMSCRMVKQYATHVIFYDGRADESGVYGTWSQGAYFSGGFHLWPKQGGNEEEAVAEKVDAKQLAGAC
ncbi:hypothetical protein [Lewinella sp. W8]|uniref:hypothetical protein n=1 Tax=Lewinella sp. W8 TaxID=2528208 RepID=UPI001067FA29|nr:hypothetical protein [Lewinella sp. W8]MTB50907.1 hypothetical protein [Lewinella sp. W8]